MLTVILYAKYVEYKNQTIVHLFYKQLKKHPNKIMFIHDDKRWTFQEIENYSNRVAHYFKSKISRGDSVALFMEGRPEYVGIWLGLTKLGCIIGLINSNQRHQALRHSIDIIDTKIIVYGTELKEAVKEIKEELRTDMKFYCSGLNDSLDISLKEMSKEPLMDEVEKGHFRDKFLYIYTSGTTGLPKAAVITHARYLLMAGASNIVGGIREDDICYDPLPLYHSAGGAVGVGQAICNGLTVVIRTKFSASKFWTDCIKYKCTVAQYIGETCRYLLACPERPEETQHSVRLMFGNGLRAQIWEQFVNRFKIQNISEFYGATEGNANMLNVWNRVGSVGYIPWYAEKFYPVNLIRVNLETNEPIRNADGFCIPCKVGEPGLLVGKIQETAVTSHFNGYSDKKASEKKILRDVFSSGDKVFNSGDVLVKDIYGYYYFKDRTGDTFRWKGENVSTSEVEAVISNIVGLKDAAVYGVEIPHTDGKAGMAAIIDPDSIIDLDKLYKGICQKLSTYARPIFIRIMKSVPLTSTFKLQKFELQKDGYDINKINDPIYFLDKKEDKYLPMTEEVYNKILNCTIRM